MALTHEVTKVEVRESSGNKMITLRCTLKDNGIEFSSKEFSVDFNANSNLQVEVQKLQEKMQAYIDKAVPARNLYNNATLDNAVTWLQNNTTVEVS